MHMVKVSEKSAPASGSHAASSFAARSLAFSATFSFEVAGSANSKPCRQYIGHYPVEM